MHLEKICVSNFRCFPESETSIFMEQDLTCFVGNNGSGKTTMILALKRLFGANRQDRVITREDFYLAMNETYKDIVGRELYIEVVFIFPELNDDIQNARETCPAFSSVIFADENDKKLKARMRLEAVWSETEYEDEVQSRLYWITTSEKIEFGDETDLKYPVSPQDRKHIKLRYIPAFRDSTSILRDEVKLLAKLLADYSDINHTTQETIKKASEKLSSEVQGLDAIKTTTGILKSIWQEVHDNTLKHYQEPKIEATPTEVDELLRSISIKLAPTENGESCDLKGLSDGQVSLLYVTLSMALYELEQKHYAREIKGFKELDKDIAVFTIFAFEEPENHLSPYYLGKVIKLLHLKTQTAKAIGIITSHSSSVVRRMKRVEQIRYFRQEINTDIRYSVVKKILLPLTRSDDDYKYINQAVTAHPELYFSKLVILGEGDSEEIVIPQLANKLGLDLDPSFVAFVKLGGRHVIHMWRLLNDLAIPYVTLLDLDLGRQSGGPVRIKNIIDELEKQDKYIELPKGMNKKDLSATSIKQDQLNELLIQLEKCNIFFSVPLDLDMVMIQSFPSYYCANARDSKRKILEKAVLGDACIPDAYSQSGFSLSDDELKKYRYLFCTKSKVASHYQAMAEIRELPVSELEEHCPDSIRQLIKLCSKLITRVLDNE
ncbi:TPA: AAA family ATPase [Legionella pneumophila]|uniref:ATP-dependent nuclease n=1 Tax=Legionella pneumophila TaxID=446 RepID=UPI00058EE7BE|nr:AAA family ATPase [Legionella pneumophila]HAT8950048.1 AAA family ATPase [Legionella pneumophila subsp. pneumophila]MCO1452555.1 AAA family ATPase [Legionella pneumophila]MCZ4723982.1 AAA family ATPase [Legionella pneumophila]MCZ4728912.1 AAA family ATPase [Legionella pneumophila]MCZ4733746.1 AAA family ATPase [Legionella pneumophila]